MGFLDHLEELRWRIIKSLAAVLLFAIGAFICSDYFIDLLLLPTKRVENFMTIQVLKVQGMLMLKFWVAFVMGIVCAIPVIMYQFWAFVSPGLYPDEKRWGPGLVISVTLFFLAGSAFAYFVIIPFAMNFLIKLGAEEVRKNISIIYYTKFVLQLIVATGIIFQMPILSFMLTKMGLITPRILRKYWRYAVVIALILAAFITPPDPVSMMMMGIPLILLYEFSIIVSRVAYKPSEVAEEQEEDSLAG